MSVRRLYADDRVLFSVQPRGGDRSCRWVRDRRSPFAGFADWLVWVAPVGCIACGRSHCRLLGGAAEIAVSMT